MLWVAHCINYVFYLSLFRISSNRLNLMGLFFSVVHGWEWVRDGWDLGIEKSWAAPVDIVARSGGNAPRGPVIHSHPYYSTYRIPIRVASSSTTDRPTMRAWYTRVVNKNLFVYFLLHIHPSSTAFRSSDYFFGLLRTNSVGVLIWMRTVAPFRAQQCPVAPVLCSVVILGGQCMWSGKCDLMWKSPFNLLFNNHLLCCSTNSLCSRILEKYPRWTSTKESSIVLTNCCGWLANSWIHLYSFAFFISAVRGIVTATGDPN